MYSLGIGNTNTAGSNTTGIPLLGIFLGDHTTAYYKDETVINFLYPQLVRNRENQIAKEIKSYQLKTWGQIGSKTVEIKFNNGKIVDNKKERK